MQKKLLNSPRLKELKKKKQKVVVRKVVIYTVAIVGIFALLTYISRLPSVNISEVQIVGNKVLDTDILKASVEKEIAGKYLWLFPRTNTLLYPKSYIERDLGNQFKRIQAVNVSTKDNKILEISITERVPAYTWCGDGLPPLLDKEGAGGRSLKCNFLDETGFMFDEAPYFSGEVYFKFYGILPPDFTRLISLKKSLEDMKLKPAALTIQDDGDIKVYLASGAKEKPEVILHTSADFEKVAENLQAALATEPLQSKFKKDYNSLEYIDLRFGNKVYYKFK